MSDKTDPQGAQEQGSQGDARLPADTKEGGGMMVWSSVNKAVSTAGPPPAGKPWRVTRYRAHWYWGYPVGPVDVFDFRWYWQANAASFIWHHLLRWSCNTWRANGEPANTEARKQRSVQSSNGNFGESLI